MVQSMFPVSQVANYIDLCCNIAVVRVSLQLPVFAKVLLHCYGLVTAVVSAVGLVTLCQWVVCGFSKGVQ